MRLKSKFVGINVYLLPLLLWLHANHIKTRKISGRNAIYRFGIFSFPSMMLFIFTLICGIVLPDRHEHTCLSISPGGLHFLFKYSCVNFRSTIFSSCVQRRLFNFNFFWPAIKSNFITWCEKICKLKFVINTHI